MSTSSVKEWAKQPTQVWEVRFIREGQRFFVKTLDTAGAIDIWKENDSKMDIMVEGSRHDQVAGILAEREIPFSIALPDVGALVEIEKNTALYSPGSSSGYQNDSMNWTAYHELDVIYSFMENLVTEFPNICSLYDIGKSVEGRPLVVLKISNGKRANAGVWIDGAIHSREWISTAVVTYIADTLARTYADQPEYVTNKDWYFLPVLNPDGYSYTFTHDRMWRKNRARYRGYVGVDLNRNFSYGFGENGEEGSSQDPGSIFYRGPKPFSEPETEAVRQAITQSDTEFKVFLSLHSYGEVVIFPYGFTSDPCPDYVELMEGGLTMVKAIYETSGRTYRVGSTKDLMYYAAGTSVDWSYGAHNIPYSYMLELRSKRHKFLLPKEEIVPTAVEIYNGILKLMDFVDRRSKGTQYSDRGKGTQSADHGKDTQSADHGKNMQSADHGKDTQTADHGKSMQSADHGKDTQTADHGKSMQSADHGKETKSADHGKGTRSADRGKGTQSPDRGKDTQSANREK